MVRRLDASAIEGGAPINVVARLAPQELYKANKVPTKGAGERDKTDKKSLRRRMKVAKKSERKQSEVRMQTMARLDPRKQGALDKKEALKSLSKNRNVTILKKDSANKKESHKSLQKETKKSMKNSGRFSK